ncbi:1-acyl-sn-glycerol-3-phosphate acyltransferase [Desulfobotulus sp. H1]|uniref:1-acyl-sn-glycerol-3-phosphate acyltransferase n=1 Tax=Desulfobotulus pelophilus TaxID=2823377 RepID=A0ABT3N914_9BACT|nr:1-acyl-sn-glycerol-3-phosphate acyltransferase [Desulfobotulus pelophilus]MCW7753948.1 1-acyl-sn-glycerol-3-phosphate acyltransferase [Desulfobotulus pelophilus]
MKIQTTTIFDTPVLNWFFWMMASGILWLFGWKIEGDVPEEEKKMVMIAAPHTSNWDFFWTLLLALKLRLKVYMMGKKELTEKPLGFLLKWMGLVPVDRSRKGNTVELAVEVFGHADRMVLIIPPSGTRSRVSQWKTGFYHIARGAKVPIGLGYLDYATKKGGMGMLLYPSGDMAADMERIRAFYSGISGKYPDKAFQDEKE